MLYRRYIFRQVLWACLAAIGLFVGVLLAGNILKDVLRYLTAGQMGFGVFFRLLLTLIPSVIAYALPLGMLTGILVSVGRMSAQNELLLLKTAGVSLGSIAKPILFLAFLGTLLSLSINFFYAPRALAAYRSGLKNMVRENPIQFIQPKQFIRDFDGYILYAMDQQQSQLQEFRIWEFDENGQVAVVLSAQRATIHYNQSDDALQLALQNGSLRRRDGNNSRGCAPMVFFQDFSINLPLAKIFGGNGAFQKRLKHMDLFELWRARSEIAAENIPNAEIAAAQRRLAIDFILQSHLAMAFSIFTLALLAIPLALKTQRKETSANVAMALGLAMAYYFATVVISWLQDIPSCRPQWLVWLPNLVILSTGILLFRRAAKH